MNVGDIAEVGPGNLKCTAVYFAVCSHWSGGRGEKVHIVMDTVFFFIIFYSNKIIESSIQIINMVQPFLDSPASEKWQHGCSEQNKSGVREEPFGNGTV